MHKTRLPSFALALALIISITICGELNKVYAVSIKADADENSISSPQISVLSNSSTSKKVTPGTFKALQVPLDAFGKSLDLAVRGTGKMMSFFVSLPMYPFKHIRTRGAVDEEKKN